MIKLLFVIVFQKKLLIKDRMNIIKVLIVVINIESTLFSLEEYDAKMEVNPENIDDTKAYIIHMLFTIIIMMLFLKKMLKSVIICFSFEKGNNYVWRKNYFRKC